MTTALTGLTDGAEAPDGASSLSVRISSGVRFGPSPEAERIIAAGVGAFLGLQWPGEEVIVTVPTVERQGGVIESANDLIGVVGCAAEDRDLPRLGADSAACAVGGTGVPA